jgi:putative DNA primase/helicase
VDRQDRSRPPIIIDRPHLTVGISPQPDVLESLRDKPGFRGRGLLARFLYALPQSRLGYRTLAPKSIPWEVENRYRQGIRQLIEYHPDPLLRLRFSPSAYREWKDFQRALEPQFRDGGMLQSLKDWGGKLAGAAARLSGIYHMVLMCGRNDPEAEIAGTTVTQAIELATCLISHAQAVFALMDRDPAINDAEKLVGWIVRQGRPFFTVRECFRSHQGRFQRVDAMLTILVLLEQHGYIRRVRQDSGGGRPASDLCEVNPGVLNRGGDELAE